MTEVLTGQMIHNVRLDKFLGQGSVGMVYRGHHTTLGIDVAVKVLKMEKHQAQASYYYERFKREAQIAAKLDHPNLVKVRDFGLYNSIPYIVMDLVDGFSLQEYQQRRKERLDEQTILKVLLAVADALAVAHEAGIIHRDLKPANILISKKGQLKVVDLGLAREEGMPAITLEQVTVGSPAYMSPESLTPGGKSDHRSDLYALGVMGYEMVFGQLPYSGDIVQIIHGHLGGQARFDLATNCGADTVELIQKMMAHDASGRYQSAREIVAAVRALLSAKYKQPKHRSGAPTTQTTPEESASSSTPPAQEHASQPPNSAQDTPRSLPSPSPIRLWLWGVLASVILGVLALLAYLLLRS